MDKITEKKQQRMKLVTDARALLDKAEKEKRSLSADETTQYEAMDRDIDALSLDIERLEKLEGFGPGRREGRAATPETETPETDPGNPQASEEYRGAFGHFLRNRDSAMIGERRAMSILTPADGGVLVPTTLQNRIVKVMYDRNYLRQLATVIRITNPINVAQQIGYGDAQWEGESDPYFEDSDKFKEPILNFTPKKLTRLTRVPEELVQDSLFDLEAFITNNIGISMAHAEERALCVGTGIGQPTGITKEITNKVEFASPEALSFDDFLELESAVKPVYRQGASVLMNDQTAKLFRKLKDNLGRYLWTPSVDKGNPDQIFSYPVYRAWAMPAYANGDGQPVAGNMPIIFGDISNYWITSRMDMSMQRLIELFAAQGQIGYRAYMREDAHLTNTEAVAGLVVPAGAAPVAE